MNRAPITTITMRIYVEKEVYKRFERLSEFFKSTTGANEHDLANQALINFLDLSKMTSLGFPDEDN